MSVSIDAFFVKENGLTQYMMYIPSEETPQIHDKVQVIVLKELNKSNVQDKEAFKSIIKESRLVCMSAAGTVLTKIDWLVSDTPCKIIVRQKAANVEIPDDAGIAGLSPSLYTAAVEKYSKDLLPQFEETPCCNIL